MDTSGASGPGLMPPPGFMDRESRTPARVNFAFDIVNWANDLEKGTLQRSYEGGPPSVSEGRSLEKSERVVYHAALEVMRLYLTGEMSFDDEEDSVNEPEGAIQEDSEASLYCKEES